jgi:hypothetical protein
MNGKTKYGMLLSQINTTRHRILVTQDLTVCAVLVTPLRMDHEENEGPGQILLSATLLDDEDETHLMDATLATTTVREAAAVFYKSDLIRLFDHVHTGGEGSHDIALADLDPLPEGGLTQADLDDLFGGSWEDDE